ncbi:MAG: MmcQ/YjbR family DNA-binding protein [Bacteroidia bacterium]|nr:MmcQ/YjbR family DNA-binding protein [Bacteroidia bacterium]
MDIVSLREFCISLPHVEESFPFDENTLVFKVGGKIFLLVDIESNPLSFNVKCNPELAIELREKYTHVKPGYHMNKKHWNTIVCETNLNDTLLKNWIDLSYNLVLNSLPKKIKSQLK